MKKLRRASQIDTSLFPPELLAALETITLPLRATPRRTEAGAHRTRHIGDSLEFADIRPYVPGDDLRTVDWNAYRRFRRLYVRRYQAEQSRDLVVLIDISPSMAVPPAKFRAAQTLAGAVAVLAGRSADRVLVLPFSDRLAATGARASRGGVPIELLRFVSGLRPGGGTRIGPVIRELASVRPRGSAIVLISDCLDAGGIETATAVLRNREIELLLFHTLADTDTSWKATGLHRLIDAENDTTHLLAIDTRTQHAFSETVAAWCAHVEDAVRSVGGHYVRAGTSLPVIDILRSAR